MSFNDDARLDTSGVSSGGRGRGGLAVGGGIGGLVIVVIGLFFGVDLTGGGSGDAGGAPAPDSTLAQQCRTGADANRDVTCRVVGTQNSVQAYWQAELPKYGTDYTPARLDPDGQSQSACGAISATSGPFYCPTDTVVYVDPAFFDELTTRFGADDGALAQEYVVAHEYGHHVQDILGLLSNAQRDPQGADSGAVRTELQADCLAGMWANGAAQTKDANGRPFLKPLTKQDIDSALSAASAVGDDRIQQKAQGRVNQESWTHGSAAQRQRWFTTGYTTGSLKACDTFSAARL